MCPAAKSSSSNRAGRGGDRGGSAPPRRRRNAQVLRLVKPGDKLYSISFLAEALQSQKICSPFSIPLLKREGPSSTKASRLVVVPEMEERLRALARAVATGQPVVLSGPSGSGKTSLVEYLAAAVGREDFRYAIENCCTDLNVPVEEHFRQTNDAIGSPEFQGPESGADFGRARRSWTLGFVGLLRRPGKFRVEAWSPRRGSGKRRMASAHSFIFQIQNHQTYIIHNRP